MPSGATAELGYPGCGRISPVSGSKKSPTSGFEPASTAGSQVWPPSSDRAASIVARPLKKSARAKMARSVPFGSTLMRGAWSIASGPG